MSKTLNLTWEKALLSLERALGDGRVMRDPDVLQAYAIDESEAHPAMPDGVVRATSADEVAAVLRIADEARMPVTPRAGGTGRTGGAVPVCGGIVLAFEGMNQIKEVDSGDMVAVVEPGVITGQLHAAVEREGLFYPPDPNSLNACAIGGNIAENAAGPRAFKYGSTKNYVLGLEVVLPNGTPLSLGGRTLRNVTGYDLASLIVGSEGTLAVVTQATLRLVPNVEAVSTVLVLLRDVNAAGDFMSRVVKHGLNPRCVELMDSITLGIVRKHTSLQLADGVNAMLLIELDGSQVDVDQQLDRVSKLAEEAKVHDVLVARSGTQREELWATRREMSRALRKAYKNKLSEDIVVPRSQIGAMLDACRQVSEETGITLATYGHAGDGNLHVNFLWNDVGEQPKVDRAIELMFRHVIRLRGTLSGEHGIGILKVPYLHLQQGPELIELQRRVKRTLDPHDILNPGKIFPPPGSTPKATHG